MKSNVINFPAAQKSEPVPVHISESWFYPAPSLAGLGDWTEHAPRSPHKVVDRHAACNERAWLIVTLSNTLAQLIHLYGVEHTQGILSLEILALGLSDDSSLK